MKSHLAKMSVAILVSTGCAKVLDIDEGSLYRESGSGGSDAERTPTGGTKATGGKPSVVSVSKHQGGVNGTSKSTLSGTPASGGVSSTLNGLGGTIATNNGEATNSGGNAPSGGATSSSVTITVSGSASNGGSIATGGNPSGGSGTYASSLASGGTVTSGGTSGLGGTTSKASAGGSLGTGGQPSSGGMSFTGGTTSNGGSGGVGAGGTTMSTTTGRCPDGTWGPSCANCVVYVRGTTGNDSRDGTSWSRALATVQGGVNTAQARITAGGFTSCEVWVAAGAYTTMSSHIIRSTTPLYGGFVGNEIAREQRDWKVNTTTINGVITTSVDVAKVLLDGFEITTSINLAHGTLTVNNCRFTGTGTDAAVTGTEAAQVNVTNSNFSNGGPGISCTCSVKVDGTFFQNATTAISVQPPGNNITATRSTFSSSDVDIPMGTGNFDSCSFLGTASIGGGQSTIIVANSSFDKKEASATPGCLFPACYARFTNCTFGNLP